MLKPVYAQDSVNRAAPTSQAEAQRRVDRIFAFRDELASLRDDDILSLDDETRDQVERHHEDLLADLNARFGVDRNASEKQLSIGLRVASFLGALALAASVFFFFYRFWGYLDTPLQVAILVGAPLLTLLGTEAAFRRESSGYYANLGALIAFSCFVLNLSVLGQIFNITPSENAFLIWSLFGFVLAYGYRLRLLLVFGILSLIGFLSARMGTFWGVYWLHFGDRPENFLPVGTFMYFLPSFARHKVRTDFPPLYRIFGLLTIFLSILMLSNWGYGSYFLIDSGRVEGFYQVLGFVVAAAAIAHGIRRGFKESINIGSTMFVLFLYTKFFDWWWDWLPKYLFFLVIGLTAVAALVILRSLRFAAVQPGERKP